jgi:hypothetical protein
LLLLKHFFVTGVHAWLLAVHFDDVIVDMGQVQEVLLAVGQVAEVTGGGFDVDLGVGT